ncbi:MAG: hypothetical protein BroJett003_22110 [Planctomycetota bacterium]|nr:MAG: hypothetical protein BroJett003_22110 [Planctomycetota bacterium]
MGIGGPALAARLWRPGSGGPALAPGPGSHVRDRLGRLVALGGVVDHDKRAIQVFGVGVDVVVDLRHRAAEMFGEGPVRSG